MRIVFVGAGDLTVETASLLIERGHEVVIIEADREKTEELSEQMDCSFLHGDGSKPHILDEAGPEHTDFLFCLTENDQHNIIAALVGRSLGFSKVILQIHDEDYLQICRELGLENTITPSKTIARYLADMVAGIDILELSSLIKGEARCMMIQINPETKGKVEEIELPDDARIICLYRDGKFMLPEPDSNLHVDDEVIILTHSKNLSELMTRFHPKQSEKNNHEGEE